MDSLQQWEAVKRMSLSSVWQASDVLKEGQNMRGEREQK